MIELLRDPAWQFVGVLLALIAIAATIIIYLLQRQKKRIAFNLVSKNQLLTVREELEGKLQVLYDGQPARDIRLLVIRVSNVGNVAIATNDYERPLSFSTGLSSKVLSAVVTDVDPPNLDVDLGVNESQIMIKPVLLNPKDSLTIKCLVSDFSDQLNVDARIIGVRKIEDAGTSSGYQTVFTAISLILTLVGFYLMIRYNPKPDVRPPTPIEVQAGMAFLAAGYIGLFVFFFKTRNLRRIAKLLSSAIRG